MFEHCCMLKEACAVQAAEADQHIKEEPCWDLTNATCCNLAQMEDDLKVCADR
jgi:hypothetical protein